MSSILKKLTLAIVAAGTLAISPISLSTENTAHADYGYRGWRGDGYRNRRWRDNDWRARRWYPPYFSPVYDPYYYGPVYQPYSFGYVPWYDVYRVPGVGRW